MRAPRANRNVRHSCRCLDEDTQRWDPVLEHRVPEFPAARLREDPDTEAAAITDLLGDRPRIVHFDVDAVDSVDLPLAEYPHFNTGVDLDVAARLLARLCATDQLAAVVVTEANPRRDPDGIHIPRLRDALARALGTRSG